jgi:hypothetical protein
MRALEAMKGHKQRLTRTDLDAPKYICMTQVSPKLREKKNSKLLLLVQQSEWYLAHASGSGHCGIHIPVRTDPHCVHNRKTWKSFRFTSHAIGARWLESALVRVGTLCLVGKYIDENVVNRLPGR